MKVIHYASMSTFCGMVVSYCGYFGLTLKMTTHVSEVTCKKCLMEIQKGKTNE